MCLVDVGEATHLGAKVSHFCLFSCVKMIDPEGGYDHGKHGDEMKVKFANAADADLFVVWLPTKFSVDSNTRHAVEFTAASGGVEVGGGFEREMQTANVLLPAGENPSCMIVRGHAQRTWLGMRERKCPERLIVCTIHDESDTTRLEFYDSFIVRGGESWTLLPKRLETGYQKCYRVRKDKVVLSHVAMALAGIVAPNGDVRGETKAPWGLLSNLFSSRNRK